MYQEDKEQSSSQKNPVDPAVFRSIIDRHGAEEASLKDLRIAAISSLGFAGFFRFNELANIQPEHLTLLNVLCQGVKRMYIERAIMFTSLS